MADLNQQAASRIEALVDLDRYPLADPDARARIVADARAAFADTGAALLPGFLRSEAVAAMAAEALRLLPVAYRRDHMLTAYGQSAEDWMEPDHPVRRTAPYRMWVTATDQMDPAGPTLAVYDWQPLTDLVRDILGLPALYRVADPLMRCNFTILRDGDAHGWHFDGNDFVVSLLLQKPEEGGLFEYAPGIRSGRDENYDGVRAVMDDTPGLTRFQDVAPGTLVLFRGRQALHRVTPVRGARPRVIALLSYDERPEQVWGPDSHRRVFGRTVGEPAVVCV
ncbi:MAG: arpA protein [Rhodospirillaceae bacterium]|nr:arpA protein [Rhodospirillaceae bacterium]